MAEKLLKLPDSVSKKSGLPKVMKITGLPEEVSLSDGLTSINNLSSTADQIIYSSGKDTYSLTTLTPFARKILALEDNDALMRLSNFVSASWFDDCDNSWTAYGYPALSTVGAKFGTGLRLDGISGAELDGTFTLGGGTQESDGFTVECFVTPTTTDNGRYMSLYTANTTGNNPKFAVGIVDRKFSVTYWDSSGTKTTLDGTTTVTANQTYHVVVVANRREDSLGGGYKGFFGLYVDGKNEAYKTNILIPQSKFNLCVGTSQTHSAGMIGTIDEFRLSNYDRYSLYQYNTSKGPELSTYTVPTAEFTKDANTLSLLHFTNKLE